MQVRFEIHECTARNTVSVVKFCKLLQQGRADLRISSGFDTGRIAVLPCTSVTIADGMHPLDLLCSK